MVGNRNRPFLFFLRISLAGSVFSLVAELLVRLISLKIRSKKKKGDALPSSTSKLQSAGAPSELSQQSSSQIDVGLAYPSVELQDQPSALPAGNPILVQSNSSKNQSAHHIMHAHSKRPMQNPDKYEFRDNQTGAGWSSAGNDILMG